MTLRTLTTAIVFASIALGARGAWAQHAVLPPSLVALDTEEGQTLFAQADAKRDFFPLATAFVTQNDPGYCGVASAVVVLNALQVRAPEASTWRAAYFTQDNLFNAQARTIIEPGFKGGVTLQQLADVIRSHPAMAEVTYASDATPERFRADVAKNLAHDGDFVIANFERSEIGQEFMGHFSPIAAYDARSDKFLLMDVARYKYPPVWVDAAALFRAMNTKDIVAGKSRGWITVTASATVPGPSGSAPPRSPIRILIGIIALAFVLGAALGAGVQTVRYRRKMKRATS